MLRDNTQTFTAIVFALFISSLVVGCGDNLTAEENLAKARSHLKEGNINAGIIELKNTLQKDPDLAEARWMLGNTYLRQGNGAAAVKELTHARELGIKTDDSLKALLNALLINQDYETVLKETESLSATDADILAIRAAAFLGSGKTDEATSTYNTALEVDNNSIESLLGLARMSLSQKDFASANAHIDKALEIANDEPRIWLLKGMLELSQGNSQQAEEAYRSGIKHANQHPTLHIGLTRTLIAQNKLEDALESIKTTEALYPNNLPNKFFRGHVAYLQKDNGTAKDNLREVITYKKDHLQSLLLLGNILYTERQMEQAGEYIGRFIDLAPDHKPARKLLGAIQINLRQFQQAIDTLTPLLDSGDNDAQTLALLGSAHMRVGNVAKGTELLEQAVELNPEAASLRTQLALSKLATGDTKKALTELNSAVKLDSNLVQADILLIMTYMREKQFKKAIDAATQLSKKRPDNPVPTNMMGAAYLGLKDSALARQQFEKALKLKSDFTPAMVNLASLDIQQGHIKEATDRYKQIIGIAEGHERALLALAAIANNKKEYDEALTYLQIAREKNPGALKPRILLARYYLQQLNAEQALTLANETVELNKNNIETRLLLIDALRLGGKNEQALRKLKQLAAENPKSADMQYLLAKLHFSNKNTEDGIEAINNALELDPTHLKAKTNLTQYEATKGNTEKSLGLAREIQKDHPTIINGHALEGDILRANKQYKEAINAYDNALAIAKSSAVVRNKYQTYLLNENKAQARTTLEDWLNNNPDDAIIRLLLAENDQAANNPDSAIKEYEKILQDKGDNVIVLNNLAWLYIKKDLNKAAAYGKRAYKMKPDLLQVLDTYGWILIAQGKTKEGMELLKKAIEKAPKSPEITYHLAKAYADTGDNNEAIKLLNTILNNKQEFSEKAEAEQLLKSLSKN